MITLHVSKLSDCIISSWNANNEGNDITSSCFYTIGLVMFIAGKWAPVSLILVALVLVLYQTAYSEVGTALPLNGGTYNILLNTTNKLTAAIAASLTILSYTATAVVSANTAMTYAHLLSDKVPILWATVGTLHHSCAFLLFHPTP